MGMWVTRSSLFCAAKNIHRCRPGKKKLILGKKCVNVSVSN